MKQKIRAGLGLGLGVCLSGFGCDAGADDEASLRFSPMQDCEWCEVDEQDAVPDEIGPYSPPPPSGGSYETLHFKSVNNHVSSFPEFWSLPSDVRKGIYLSVDCPANAKYLVLLSNGQQGLGNDRNGNESRTIGVPDTWRKDHCAGHSDCDLSLHENGLLRRVMEGNFFPPGETCEVFIADNASRALSGEGLREDLVEAYGAYIDRLVDVADLEFMFVGAASRGAGMTFPLVLDLIARNGGDATIPGSGWSAVPKVLAFNDPVWRHNDPYLDTFLSPNVQNPMIEANYPYEPSDTWNTIDFAQELGNQVINDRVRIVSVVGGDAVVPGIRAAGTNRFETVQDMRGWDNPIEVFAQQCIETSAPYYTQINVRYPLTHSGLNGTLEDRIVSTFSGIGAVILGVKDVHFLVNPGQIYDTAALDVLAAGLEDYGVRPSGYAFVDGSGASIVPTAVPSIRTGASMNDPSPSLAGATVVRNEVCAPPSCHNVCDDQLETCMQRFCVDMPEPYMCNVVCTQRFNTCVAGC